MPLGTPTLLGSILDTTTSGAGEDLTFTVPGGGVAQDTLLILALVTTNGTIDSMTDTRGNTYTQHVSLKHSGVADKAHLISAPVTTALQAADTIVISFAAFEACGLAVYTVTGAHATAPFDTSASAQMDFAVAYSSGNTAVTAQADELLFGVNSTNDETATFTATGGFTELNDVNSATPSVRLQTQYQIVSAAAAYASTATLSTNNDGVALIATFKQAGGAPPPTDTTTRRYQTRRSRMTSW